MEESSIIPCASLRCRVNIVGQDALTIRKLALFYGNVVGAAQMDERASLPLDGGAQTPHRFVETLPEVNWELWDVTGDIEPQKRSLLHRLAQALIIVCDEPKSEATSVDR